MRDIDIRKDSEGPLRVLAIVVLVVAVLLVAGVAVVGFVAWRMMQPQPQTMSVSPPSQPVPGMPGQFGPGPVVPPPPVDVGPLESLPPAPALPAKPDPPEPARKPIEITAVRSFAGHAGPILSVAFSPDERRVLSGGNDCKVRLWDIDKGEELAKLEGHGGPVHAVAFAPDGKRAASASSDATLRLWDLTEKKSIRIFKGHEGGVFCAAFTPDGKQLLSGGADRSLRVWDVETGEAVSQWYGHDAAVHCLAVAPDGGHALSGGADGGVAYWDLRAGRQVSYLSVEKPVSFALLMPDGKRAVVGGDAPPRLCELSTGEQWPAIWPGQPPRAAALLPGDAIVLLGAGTRLDVRALAAHHVRQAQLARRGELGSVEAHAGAITCLCVTRDGRLALTAGEDGAVKLWRLSARE